MLVLKTTSPIASPSAPNERPEKEVPSSNKSTARFMSIFPSVWYLSGSIFDDLSGDHHRGRPPLHLPSDERRILTLRFKTVPPDRPFRSGIDDRQIGDRSDRQPADLLPDDLGRIQRQLPDHLRQGQRPLFHQDEGKREGRLQPDDAEW